MCAHINRAAVHGFVLLSHEAVRRRQHLPQLCESIHVCMHRFPSTRAYKKLTVQLACHTYIRYNDDDFNYNHGIALAATRNYKAAEEALLLIHNVRTPH